MKKLAKVAVLTVAGFMVFAFTNIIREATFEGIITYDIKVDSDNPQVAQMMQGSTIKTYIKGDMSRTETSMGMYSNIVIANRKKPDETVMLMNIMGNKYQLKLDDKAKKEAEKNAPDVKYLDGTKTIAGYACKEAQLTMTDKKSGNKYTSDIFYTDQLPYNNEGTESQFKGLKGFPLSYSVKQSGMSMNMTAKSIDKQAVPDSVFNVPTGYKLMTMDEMQKDMMSHMGGGSGN
jgi:GLPGLI family protein